MQHILCFGQKRGKRRWIFKKQSHGHQETVIQHSCEANVKATKCAVTAKPTHNNNHDSLHDDHALAVAMATARAAKAAVEAIRLTRPNNYTSIFIREHLSAIAIQTAFRGYLVVIYINSYLIN